MWHIKASFVLWLSFSEWKHKHDDDDDDDDDLCMVVQEFSL